MYTPALVVLSKHFLLPSTVLPDICICKPPAGDIGFPIQQCLVENHNSKKNFYRLQIILIVNNLLINAFPSTCIMPASCCILELNRRQEKGYARTTHFRLAPGPAPR